MPWYDTNALRWGQQDDMMMRKRMIFFYRKLRWYERLFWKIYFKINFFECMDKYIEQRVRGSYQ